MTGMKEALLVSGLAVLAIGCGSSLTPNPGGTGGGGAAGSGFVGTGGSIGPAGAAGSNVGGAGGGSTAAACGTHDPFGPLLRTNTVGPRPTSVYEGWAVVERSTATELVLAYQPDGMTLPLHETLFDLYPMPILPVAARVWLFNSPSVEQSPPTFPFRLQPWSVIVHDRQGGRIVLGAAWKPTAVAPSPVPLGAVTPTCTVTELDGCNAGGMIIYSSVDVQGDQVVAIPDSQTKTVAIDGFDYDVRISAQQQIEHTGPATCADFFVDGGVAVDVQAQDLEGLSATLGTAVAPACSEGNDDGPHITVSLTDTGTRDYDGPIFYRGRSPNNRADCAAFDPVGLTSATGYPPTVEICAPAAIFPEPRPGQELWVSTWSYYAAAVFGPQRGPLLLAAASVTAPYDDGASAMLEHVLGIHVDAEARCLYASPDATSVDGTSLYDLVFATTPPTRVQSKAITTVRIANQDRRVWVSGEGRGVWFVIF